MGMGKVEVEGIGMGIGVDLELKDELMLIPRRKRSSHSPIAEKKPPIMSMLELETATVLLAMAYSVSDVEAFCNQELENFNNTHKRKRAATIHKSDAIATTTKKLQKPRKKKSEQTEFPSIPEMPAAMRDRIVEMGGYQIELVMQKQLQDTDVNKNDGRLSIPPNKLRVDFTTEEERCLLRQKENNTKKGMNVVIMDHVLRESRICLKKWKIGGGDSYCLITHWNSFVEENALKSGEHIQLWCFRRDEFQDETQTMASRLCFAMVKLHVTTCG